VRNNYDVNQGSQAARQLVDFLVAILTRSFYNYLKMTEQCRKTMYTPVIFEIGAEVILRI